MEVELIKNSAIDLFSKDHIAIFNKKEKSPQYPATKPLKTATSNHIRQLHTGNMRQQAAIKRQYRGSIAATQRHHKAAKRVSKSTPFKYFFNK